MVYVTAYITYKAEIFWKSEKYQRKGGVTEENKDADGVSESIQLSDIEGQ